MALDFSALGDEYGDTSNDVFRRLPIDDIIEDPDQPRTEFDPVALEALSQDIKRNGQIQPIVVRPANSDGKFKIIVGARRYRACKLGGESEMDVLVRDTERLDEYSQVSENHQREGLSPLEMANFIAKRQAAGEKNADIARKLGIDKSAVTQYCALIEAPEFLMALYNQGKCTNPLYIYELKKIWKTWPDEVEVWAAKAEDITRSSIKALYDRLRGPEKEEPKVTVMEQTGLSGKSGLDSVSDTSGTPAASPESSQVEQSDRTPEVSTTENTETSETVSPEKVTVIPAHNPDIEKQDEETASDPNKIKKPLMLADYAGRAVMVLLNRRPTSSGLIHIRYEDGSGDDEVDAGALKINLLTDSNK